MSKYNKSGDVDSKIDLQKFNTAFEKEKELTKVKGVAKDKLSKLGKYETTKSIAELSISEILIGVKDSWFDLIDDLLQRQFNLSTFTKNNRLFYIGVTIIVIIIILYTYDIITTDIEGSENKRIVEVRHIYKLENDASNNTIFKLAQAENQDSKFMDNLVRDVVVLDSGADSDL